MASVSSFSSHVSTPVLARDSTNPCEASCAGSCWSFGAGRWVGADVGVPWTQLAGHRCWSRRAHKERRVPVWFDDVPDALANASCSQMVDDQRWIPTRAPANESQSAGCAAAQHQSRRNPLGAGKQFERLAARARALPGGRAPSILLVGDSVDRKM